MDSGLRLWLLRAQSGVRIRAYGVRLRVSAQSVASGKIHCRKAPPLSQKLKSGPVGSHL